MKEFFAGFFAIMLVASVVLPILLTLLPVIILLTATFLSVWACCLLYLVARSALRSMLEQARSKSPRILAD